MTVVELLAEFGRLGIRLEAQGERLRFHPRSAMTSELLSRLKAHKGELLTLLRPTESPTRPAVDAPPTSAKAVCRCGSTETTDVAIHDGASLRRDCAKCGRFVDFPVWYGRATQRTESNCAIPQPVA